MAVTAANVQDRTGADSLLACLPHQCSRLRCIWADQASTGDLAAWVGGLRPWRKVRLEIVKRPEGSHGFLLLPKRRVVERTFAWVGRDRRLSKAYEYLTQTSEAMIRVAMIHLMVRRLARLVSYSIRSYKTARFFFLLGFLIISDLFSVSYFTRSALTEAEKVIQQLRGDPKLIELLRGPKGEKGEGGPQGERGEKGEKGDPASNKP